MSRSAAALEIVRGDAYRLIGRPREAEEAYGRALAMLGELDER
jgi:predicted negative regulator of RcsB-dependent stress response